jgi:hypothetical protein
MESAAGSTTGLQASAPAAIMPVFVADRQISAQLALRDLVLTVIFVRSRSPPRLRIQKGLLLAALSSSLSCSSSPERAADAVPASNAVVGSSSVRASDEVLPTPPLPGMCSVGTGDPNASCGRGGSSLLWPQVDAAIDELVRTRPALFNLERVVGQKGYYVLAHDEFYLGVEAILQARGFCAQYDFRVLQVKDSQAQSEQFALIQPNGHLWRDPRSLAATCTPASFPLDPAVVIHRVRVAFYAIQCDDGRTPPRNGEGLLPVDCTGFVTATPKQKDDTDVHRVIHGPDIDWELEQSGGQVSVEDFPNVTFNKFVRGRDLGPFRLCATVQSHRGCLDGEVIP